MKKNIMLLIFSLLLNFSAFSMALTESDKVKLSIHRASEALQIDSSELKKIILNDSLASLSKNDEIEYHSEIVIEEIEKTMPTKNKKEILALIASTLLSESGTN